MGFQPLLRSQNCPSAFVSPNKTTTCFGSHKRPIKAFLNPMYVFAKDLMYKVQSINFACTDFWSPYLVQMGAEIRQSVADVDTDSLLSQNWPPSTLVRHGSCRSCSETESATTELKFGRKKTEKTARNATEFLISVDLGKVWPPLGQTCFQKSCEHGLGSLHVLKALPPFAGCGIPTSRMQLSRDIERHVVFFA